MFTPKLPRHAAIPAAALALALAGCPPKVVPPPRAGDTADAVLARLEAAESKVQRVRGEARLKVANEKGSGVVTLFLAAEAPGKVHLERLDFFGRPQLVLACDGAHYTLFDGEKGKWYRGPATAQAMARFFPVALSPAELAALLMGKAPRSKPTEPPQLAFDAKKGQMLTLVSTQRADIFYVSTETDRVELALLGAPLLATLEFSDWAESNGVQAPKKTRLERNDGSLRLELSWKDEELNGAADPSLYELSVPDGQVPIELDGRGEETLLKPGAVPP